LRAGKTRAVAEAAIENQQISSAIVLAVETTPIRMQLFDKVSEAELRQFEELKTVAQVTVVRLPEGWLLIVGVEGRARDLVVWSTRQRPRLWKSLDKLVSYAIDVVPSVPTFELMLGPPEDWDVEVRPKQKPGRAASGREP
jgi:hypothetical protein